MVGESLEACRLAAEKAVVTIAERPPPTVPRGTPPRVTIIFAPISPGTLPRAAATVTTTRSEPLSRSREMSCQEVIGNFSPRADSGVATAGRDGEFRKRWNGYRFKT